MDKMEKALELGIAMVMTYGELRRIADTSPALAVQHCKYSELSLSWDRVESMLFNLSRQRQNDYLSNVCITSPAT